MLVDLQDFVFDLLHQVLSSRVAGRHRFGRGRGDPHCTREDQRTGRRDGCSNGAQTLGRGPDGEGVLLGTPVSVHLTLQGPLGLPKRTSVVSRALLRSPLAGRAPSTPYSNPSRLPVSPPVSDSNPPGPQSPCRTPIRPPPPYVERNGVPRSRRGGCPPVGLAGETLPFPGRSVSVGSVGLAEDGTHGHEGVGAPRLEARGVVVDHSGVLRRAVPPRHTTASDRWVAQGSRQSGVLDLCTLGSVDLQEIGFRAERKVLYLPRLMKHF